MTSWPASQQHSRAGRLYMMFWADCSPLLPVSGSAIVARAEWMGSEPERVLKKNTPGKQQEAGVYSELCSIYRRLAHHRQHTDKHAKSHTLNRNDSRQTHEKTSTTASLSIPSLLPPPSSFLSPPCCPIPAPSSLLFPYKSGEQHGWTLALLEWSAVTGLAGRERDNTPVYRRALSLLKYITHSKWSCWSQTTVDLITFGTLYSRGAF